MIILRRLQLQQPSQVMLYTEKGESMWKKLGKEFYIAAALMIIAIVFIQRVPHGKTMPLQRDILTFPDHIGQWKGDIHKPFDPKILDVLRVDDYLNRVYYDREGSWISLYIGYFRDQISGETIHSPRNCMPGSGWNFTDLQEVTLQTKYEEQPFKIKALRSVMVHGDNRMLTYYWYQSRGRFMTNEYWHKIFLVLDAIRYDRTDGALVRVLMPLPKDAKIEQVDAQLQKFILDFTPQLQR